MRCGHRIDGNNILGVYDTVKGVRDYCIKNRKPYLIECATFRMRGHEEASGTKYVPSYLFDVWELKDPVKNYEQHLLAEGILTEDQVSVIRQDIKEYIEVELSIGFDAKPLVADEEEELNDIYALPVHTGASVIDNASPAQISRFKTHPDKRLIDAIKEGLFQSMQQHSNLVLMGQDIAEYGGVF